MDAERPGLDRRRIQQAILKAVRFSFNKRANGNPRRHRLAQESARRVEGRCDVFLSFSGFDCVWIFLEPDWRARLALHRQHGLGGMAWLSAGSAEKARRQLQKSVAAIANG